MALTITFKLGTDLDKAQVLVQNRVADRDAAPARGGAPPRRHHAQELARPDDGRAHALAGRHLRPALRLELRPQQRARRAAAARRRRRPHHLRRAAIFAADLARSRKARRLRHDRPATWCAPCRSRTSRSRAARSGSSRRRADNAFQLMVKTQGRFEDVRASSAQIIVQLDRRRPARPAAGRGARRARRAGLRHEFLPQRQAGRGARHLPAPGHQCARRRRTQIIKTMERTEAELPARASTTRSSTTRPSSSPTASTRSTRRCSRRSLLVVLVVLVFLQSWRTAIIPIVAIPVSLIGTFAVMAAFGFSHQHADAVRHGAGDRHRGRRRHRRGRECRAQHRARHVAARRRARDHGRGRQRASIAIALVLPRCSSRRRSSPASPASSTASSR